MVKRLRLSIKKEPGGKYAALGNNYQGWIDHKVLRPITASELKEYAENPIYSLELAQGVMGENHFLPILMGSSLPQ